VCEEHISGTTATTTFFHDHERILKKRTAWVNGSYIMERVGTEEGIKYVWLYRAVPNQTDSSPFIKVDKWSYNKQTDEWKIAPKERPGHYIFGTTARGLEIIESAVKDVIESGNETSIKEAKENITRIIRYYDGLEVKKVLGLFK
jgi:hypothetical protein